METPPEGSAVWLFDGNLKVDWNSSAKSWYDDNVLTLIDGTNASFIHEVFGNTHNHTLESIKDGVYWIMISCPIDYRTAEDGDYPWGYRKITVDKNIHGTTLKFTFTDEDRMFFSYRPFKEK